ncbi:MAG: RNA polymerase sporulation sigma factor SigE [Oscillospiraceae bacterium]|nr:RNA polymerase sporulation sigma factor SigE [Oscillospiraceae bacterium]
MFKKIKGFFLKIINRVKRFFRGKKNKVYYIHGSESLPTPLTPEEEGEIIARLATDESVRGVLVERNLRLVVYIAKKFENTGIYIEDLISIGTIGLIKAINTFKADKNIKLATYASRCIENEILMFIRKNNNVRGEMSFDEPLNTDRDGNELMLSDILGDDEDSVFGSFESEEDRRTVRAALAELEPREQEIISLRFGLDGGDEYTQKEVADMLGISQSYISRLEKKILFQLQGELANKV